MRFEVFVDEQRQFNKRIESDIADLKTGQEELRTGINDLRYSQARIEARMDQQEYDNSTLKDFYMSTVAGRSAETLPVDFGLEYVRTMSEADLDRMIRAANPDLSLNEVRSFRRADLVVEAKDKSGTVYVVLEASYTADTP